MRGLRWTAPALAAAGLAGFAAVFAIEQSDFRDAVLGWARRDLAVRAHMAAPALKEALDTSEWRQIRAFGDFCTENGLRMTVFSPGGGVYYDTQRPGAKTTEHIHFDEPCGEFKLRLAMPLADVLAPFERAKTLFVFSALAAAAGVFLVFLLVYRQSVRIRELKKIEKFRRDFIADFSHEMKTPLTGIIGAVDLLGDAGGDVQERKTLLALLKSEATRLNALAQSILDLARLESAGGILAKTQCDAAEIAGEIVERHAGAASRAGMSLSVAEDSAAPGGAGVLCDRRLVVQALSNLVENALRHSRGTAVKVGACKWRGGVRFTVEDDGRGIPREHAKKVFDRFHRVDPSRTAGGGAGLGLSIVRRIARLHGGEATLSAASPHGCRFTVEIP